MDGSTHITPGMIDPQGLQNAMHKESLNDKEKLKIAADQFESIMLSQILDDALKPMIKGGVFDETGSDHAIYRSMMTNVLADSMSKQGVFGISNVLQNQINAGMKNNEN